MSNNNYMLNRVFTRNNLNDIINNKNDMLFANMVEMYNMEVDGNLNKDAISKVYKFMFESHRNEYIYKNALLNKLLLGVHSLNTIAVLTEVIIDKAKADFILINGSAIVYEIKTELDSLTRLENQINNYYKAFSKVCIMFRQE